MLPKVVCNVDMHTILPKTPQHTLAYPHKLDCIQAQLGLRVRTILEVVLLLSVVVYQSPVFQYYLELAALEHGKAFSMRSQPSHLPMT